MTDTIEQISQKLELIPPSLFDKEQLRWFVRRFSGVPYFFRIHFESLPYSVTLDKYENECIVRYNEQEDIEDYIKRNIEDLSFPLMHDVSIFWQKRMIIYMVVPVFTEYFKDKEEYVRERTSHTIDVQSYGPIGADVWSSRFEETWAWFIAPVAFMCRKTWDTYAMQMLDSDGKIRYTKPDGVGGKGRSTVEEVWRRMGGKVDEMDPAWEAACRVNLENWEWTDNAFCGVLNAHAKRILAYALEVLGKEEFDKLREEHDDGFHHDLFYYEDEDDEDEYDEDEESEDEEDTSDDSEE